MSFSEDSMTPAAPFTGDGSVFDQPDVVLNLPITSERIVDTQSGFLLVLRRVGERLAFSCKRRVGTPPSSSILLTPDESLKLSRALAVSLSGLEDSLESGGRLSTSLRRKLPLTSAAAPRRASVLQRYRRPALLTVGICIVACALAAGQYVITHPQTAVSREGSPSSAPADVLSTENVDKFSRTFVTEMLDFNPLTYKCSQVKAMASMSPELLEKYWKETNFPLTAVQLKGLPQGATVEIDRIDQQRLASDTVMSSIYAQLIHANKKLSTPVRIKVKLTNAGAGGITVLEQEDLAATGN
jgi:hypothetical protein